MQVQEARRRKDLVYGQKDTLVVDQKQAAFGVHFKKNTYITHSKKPVGNRARVITPTNPKYKRGHPSLHLSAPGFSNILVS